MVKVAYQIPLKEPLVVPSETRSQKSHAIPVVANGYNLEHVLNQTASSTFALRTPVNDNSALLAELNKRIQQNPRLQAANQAHAPTADAADDQQPSMIVEVSDPAMEEAAPVEPVLTAVERTQIELAETVKFIQELRADPQRRMSKSEAKQFLHFAAGQAALSMVGEDAQPELVANPHQDMVVAGDVAQQQPAAGAIQMNPLALQALAQQYDKVMPLAEATPKTVFQNNLDVMTQAQSGLSISADTNPLPRALQSELHIIATSTQFDPALVKQAHTLSLGHAHGIQPSADALPVATPLPENEKAVAEIITQAKQQKNEQQGQAIAKKLSSGTYAGTYDIALYDPKGHKMGYQAVKGTDIDAAAPRPSDVDSVSLSDPDINPDDIVQNVVKKRDELVIETSRQVIGAKYQQAGYSICVQRGTDGHTLKANVDQKSHIDKNESRVDDIQKRLADNTNSLLSLDPQLARFNLTLSR